jgi:hypothetical protein
VVRVHPRPPKDSGPGVDRFGGLAQLGERQLCKLDVTGSIPVSSTMERQSKRSRHAARAERGPDGSVREILDNFKATKTTSKETVGQRLGDWELHDARCGCGEAGVAERNLGLEPHTMGITAPDTRLRTSGACGGQGRKSTRWMPRRQEAMKDAATCEKPRGVGSKRRSVDIRMGKPGRRHGLSASAEYISVLRRTEGTETS